MKEEKVYYFFNLLNKSNEYIFFLRPDFSIASFNENVKYLLNSTPEEIIDRDFFEFMERKDNIIKCFEKAFKKDEVIFCDLLLNFNDELVEIEVESSSIKIEEEKLLLVVLKPKNKKGYFKKNGALRFYKKIDKYFDFVQKEGKIGIWEYDIKNLNIYWSDGIYNILGLDKNETEPEIIAKSRYVDSEDKNFILHVFNNSLKERENYKITYKIVRPDGEIRYLDEHAIFVRGKDGEYILGFDIDVTERERYQRKLLEQTRIAEELRIKAEQAKKEALEANRARTIFLSNISHEIRTLLNAVLGYSQILKYDEGLNDKQKKMVDSILIAGGHLLDLINDILDITKMEMGKNRVNIVEFNLTNMFKSLYQIFKIRAEQKKIRWQIVGMPKDELLVRTDKTKLFHILLNLIGNAIKFTEKGKVELIFKIIDKNRCYFEVKDTGIGIDENLQKKIFEPFIQDEEGYKRGGTGLGLAIANSNVNLLGGELTLESTVGKGTRFYFDIPCGEVKRVKIISNTGYDNGYILKDRVSLKVLIADDIEDNIVVLKDILEHKKIEVETVKDGEKAVEKFKIFKPDIMFMDIKMPKKDGIEATKEIKAIDKDAKVVSISASSMLYKKGDLDIFDDNIDKPFNISDLDRVFLKYFPDRFKKEKIEKSPIKKSFRKLDKELKDKIISYANLGQVKELKDIIEEIENSDIRESLSRYLKNFEFDRIIEELNHKGKI